MSQFSLKIYTEMSKQNSNKIINKHYRISTISEDQRLLKRLQDEHEANRKINWSISSNKLYVYDRPSSFYSTTSSNCPTEKASHESHHLSVPDANTEEEAKTKNTSDNEYTLEF
jgi:hypothetical protein